MRALMCAVSQHAAAVSPGVSRHTPAAKPRPSCHDTIVCIMTCFANQTTRLSRYKDCIVTQPPAARPSLLSRYNALYRDTHPHPSPARVLLAVSWPPLAVSWAVSWPSQPYHGRPCAPLSPAQASLPNPML